ncbi:hypothetical protein [Syntrophomonas wolfei]|uniref:hypothetical protein n=1 Tax=Syntrophomonas wolfei TaxID=863 RepID=UPI001A990CDD|nr:hypothetical protein [Syntrophomonas wolfei]
MVIVNTIREKTIVKPGGVVEIRSGELPVGVTVEVTIVVERDNTQSVPRSLINFIGSAKGCFLSPREADEFIRGERDAWD